MASIFDLGRPSGAIAGTSVATDQRRSRRDQDLTYAGKRAEFMDYLADSELRGTAREAGIAKNKAITAVTPSATAAQVSTNELTGAQADADKTLVEPKRKLNLQKVHTAMTEQQYNTVTRAYSALTESVRAGRPPKESYDQARAEIIKAGADPKQVDKWLSDQGITEDFTTDAFNSMMGLANYGLHDSKTTRQEHLLEVEWDARRKVEMAKATTLDAPKVWTPSAEDQRAVGSILSDAVEGFTGLQGGNNDDGSYTGSKGAMVDTVTRWSYDRATRAGERDGYAVPTDYQMIAADMLNFADKQVTKDGIMWGWAHGGDKFDPIAFTNVAELATQAVENYRLKLGPNAPSAYMTWQAIRGPVLMEIERSHKKIEQGASTLPEPGLPEQVTTSSTPKPGARSQANPQKSSDLIQGMFKNPQGGTGDFTP